jgi:hypothetical protein
MGEVCHLIPGPPERSYMIAEKLAKHPSSTRLPAAAE